MGRVALISLVCLGLVAGPATGATVPRRVPAAGMTFAVPSRWKVVDAKTAASQAGAALRDENPQLAAILDQLAEPGSVIKFFSFDPVGAEQFATNVNVVVAPIPTGVTLEQYFRAARSELASLPGRVGTASTRIVRLPAGRSVQSQVNVGVVVKGKRMVTSITQWAFLRPGKSVVVTFTTSPGKVSQYRSAFASAARSIRFG